MDKQNKFYLELGRRIREARLHSRLTQEELANLLSLNRTSITNIEKGKQKILAHTLVDLAERLNVTINDLIPTNVQRSEMNRISGLLNKDSSTAERKFFEAALNKAKTK